MKRRNKWFYVAVLFFGLLIGSGLGEVLGFVLPDGVVRLFFLKSAEFSFGPLPVDLSFIKVTLGLAFKINIIGVIGILISAYILKWID